MIKNIINAVKSIRVTKKDVNTILEKIEDINNRLIKIDSRVDELEENSQLKEEFETIKNEITDCSNKIIEYVHSKDWEQNKYLYGRLQDCAGNQTAQFIIDNMNTVPNLIDSLSILDRGIEEIEVEGLILEFGVFQGRTINKIASLVNQKVYGFDSFEGLPEDWRTGFDKGKFGVDNLPEVRENVCLIKGWFDNTLPDFLKEHKEKCAFIHIDCDLYSSTKYVLNELKDRIVEGTVISFDEYFNYPGWQQGEYKAFKEFTEENGIDFEYLYYVDTHEQVAVKIVGKNK